jgi:hypothetical protein
VKQCLLPLLPRPESAPAGLIHLLRDRTRHSWVGACAPGLGKIASRSSRRLCPTRPAWPHPCGAGSKQEAIAEACAVGYYARQDASWPQATATLAQIYAWTGEFDEALRLLDHLFVVPSHLTVPMLKLDPGWDPLRQDPRFQALIEKYSPKS